MVWGGAEWRASGTVSEHVRRIRRKLAAAGAAGEWIGTMKGAGYRFEPQHLALPTPLRPAPDPADMMRPAG